MVYICVSMWTGTLVLYFVAARIIYDLKRLTYIYLSVFFHWHTESFSHSLFLFLLGCTTTPIGGWQYATTIAVTARAIRCHRCWFRRLIIIALSRSGLLLLRSSTLLSSSRRFHRSRYSSRDTTTTTATSPSVIHDSSLPLLYFSLKKKTRINILFLSQRGIFIQLPMNVN